MIYVFAPQRSPIAYDLTRALDGTRLRRFDGLDFWAGGRRLVMNSTDTVVCWGGRVPDLEDCRVLNHGKKLTRYGRYIAMARAGVPCTNHYDYQPVAGQGRREGKRLSEDLEDQPKNADCWIVPSNFRKEYRIHSFMGKSIRAGVKVHRDGWKELPKGARTWKAGDGYAHPWVRTLEMGWKTKYEGFKSTAPMREVAHRAVTALGLTFGAVDIGEDDTGSLRVISVDAAPGLDAAGLQAYAKAIRAWGELKEVPEIAAPIVMDLRENEPLEEGGDDDYLDPPDYDEGDDED